MINTLFKNTPVLKKIEKIKNAKKHPFNTFLAYLSFFIFVGGIAVISHYSSNIAGVLVIWFLVGVYANKSTKSGPINTIINFPFILALIGAFFLVNCYFWVKIEIDKLL